MNRTKAEQDGLLLLRLGVLVFVAIGAATIVVQQSTMMDVRIAQASARCLIENCDPYNANDIARMYRQARGAVSFGANENAAFELEAPYPYIPTIFVLTAPISELPFGAFCAIWMSLIIGSFLLAVLLVWDIGRQHAPLLTGALLGLYVANSASTISAANPGSLAVGLCIISIWCLFRGRFVIPGLVCLAAALAVKPHDAGLLWLTLIMLGAPYRKRALQAMAIYLIIVVPPLYWTGHVSPHWIQELSANLASVSARGQVNDPGPGFVFRRGPLMLTNLQSALSMIRDNPLFYNPVSYGVSAFLMCLLALRTYLSKPSLARRWVAIAMASVLTMLPLYHRLYDAKLLMLTIPACAMVWQRRNSTARLSLLTTACALIVTSDILWAFYVLFVGRLNLPDGFSRQLFAASIAVPIPLTLLIVSLTYLWVLARADVLESGAGAATPLTAGPSVAAE